MTYIDELERVIPLQLLAKRIDLSSIGLRDMAWRFQDVKKVLEIVKDNKLVNVGGDVFTVNDSEVDSTWDAYFYDLDKNLSWVINVEHSYNNALAYIESFHKDNGDNFCYGVVVEPQQDSA